MKLKIGYSATLWDNCRSGIGTYIAQQLHELYRRPRIDLRIFEHGGNVLLPPELPKASGTGSGTKSKLTPVKDVLWHRNQLANVVRETRVQLVHVPSIRRLPGRLPCPVVVTVHDLAPLRLRGKYGLFRDIYHKHVVPRWLENVSRIVTPSECTKKDLQHFYRVNPNKVTVVPNGVNHSLYQLGDVVESKGVIRSKYGINSPYLLYISRLEHPAKNHMALLEAFEKFRATGNSHKLVLVGARWNGSEIIERKIAEFGGSVIHVGHVPSEDLPHFLRASTALVYPSLYEGFGLPIIEAMATGVPVCCSKGSSLEEVAGGHALLFDPRKPEEIAGTMLKMAGEENLRKQLSEDGWRHAQNFTWERCVSETIHVWEEVLQK